jgi:hypothetical protein
VHSPFFIALYKGYYQAEGLDVVIDRGKGWVGLVRQLANGVYDMGYPDISVVEAFDSKNPASANAEKNQSPRLKRHLDLKSAIHSGESLPRIYRRPTPSSSFVRASVMLRIHSPASMRAIVPAPRS